MVGFSLGTAIDLFRTTIRNPALRAHALGFFLFTCAELMSWTGLLIYAHEETGADSPVADLGYRHGFGLDPGLSRSAPWRRRPVGLRPAWPGTT